MAQTHSIPFSDTAFFSELILDYIQQSGNLTPFCSDFPRLENFEDQIRRKAEFSHTWREKLSETLQTQYGNLLAEEDSGKVAQQIVLLKESNTYTVTTGHQLNIFTGPLYFIYKILSTIRLAEELQSSYAAYHFVPVFWMATEDHDLPEINFINSGGSKIIWHREQEGAVGRMSTAGMAEAIEQLSENLGKGKNASRLIEIFRQSYLNSNTLAEATRHLVHTLFKTYGLVIVDGDDAELKRPMIPYFEADLLEHRPHDKVVETTQALEKIYSGQAHPRAINLFYLGSGYRERIEREGDEWQVINGAKTWNRQSLLEELRAQPQNFSPNVILRPLYQEVILPNLAYVGGGGELAYWFQLKAMFDDFALPFPYLILRNSLQLISPGQADKFRRLGFDLKEIFQPLHTLKTRMAKDGAPVDPELAEYEKRLSRMFDELEEVANLTDRSMLGAVNAQRQKQLNGLENLKKKLLKAEKRRREDEMLRLENLYYQMFPAGVLQERKDNISPYIAAFGLDFIHRLYEVIEPLKPEFRIHITEEVIASSSI